MEHIHRILNYSYWRLDIEGYLPNFFRQREAKIAELLSCSGKTGMEGAGDSTREIAGILAHDYRGDRAGDWEIDGGIDTYGFLCRVMMDYAGGRPLGQRENGILTKLQKKFELYHRLFDGYDRRLRKKGTSFKKMHIYAMFSIILTLRYLESGNLNDWSSAVKLNDLLVFSGWPLEECYYGLVASSLQLERTVAGRLP